MFFSQYFSNEYVRELNVYTCSIILLKCCHALLLVGICIYVNLHECIVCVWCSCCMATSEIGIENAKIVIFVICESFWRVFMVRPRACFVEYFHYFNYSCQTHNNTHLNMSSCTQNPNETIYQLRLSHFAIAQPSMHSPHPNCNWLANSRQ